MLPQIMQQEYPLVLGRDAAGIVEAVGTGVDHVQVGGALVGHALLTPPVKAGALAEYVTLPAATVVRKPDGLDFVAAAALPLAGAAAAAVRAIDRQGGHVVLVNGASGALAPALFEELSSFEREHAGQDENRDVMRRYRHGPIIAVNGPRATVREPAGSVRSTCERRTRSAVGPAGHPEPVPRAGTPGRADPRAHHPDP